MSRESDHTKGLREMSWLEKLRFVKEIITVEPLMVCYSISLVISQTAVTSLRIEKACKAAKGYNDTVCDALVEGENNNYMFENYQVQEQLNNLYSWTYPIGNLVPLLLILFVGSYSDRHKLRKPFLILPLVGEICSLFGAITSVIFMREWSLETMGVLEMLVPSFFGGPTMIMVMSFAYITDVSTVEMRTLRLGTLQIFLSVSSPIVQSFSAPMFKAIGYLGMFFISGVIFTMGVLYGMFFVKEAREPVVRKDDKGFLRDILNPQHVVETFRLLTTKNAGTDRKLLVVLMHVMFLKISVNAGESRVFFLYAQVVYQWSVVEYFSYLSISTSSQLIGTIKTKKWQ